MTKMKNTKKGMAKKALSISLIAAMLATSNVPVWAAFDAEDPADVAVEAQVFDAAEPVVDEVAPLTEEPTAVEPNIIADGIETYVSNSYSVTPTIKLPADKTWKEDIQVDAASKIMVSENGKTPVDAKDSDAVTKVEYVFQADGVAIKADDGTTAGADFSEAANKDVAAVKLEAAAAEANFGKDIKLLIKVTFADSQEWIQPYDVVVNAVDISSATVTLNGTTNLTYSGEAQGVGVVTVSKIEVGGEEVTLTDPVITYSQDTVNAGNKEIAIKPNEKDIKYTGTAKTVYAIGKANDTTVNLLKVDLKDGVTVEYAVGDAIISTDSVTVTDLSKQDYADGVKSAKVTLADSDTEQVATVVLELKEGSLLTQNFSAVQASYTTEKKVKVVPRNLADCKVTVQNTLINSKSNAIEASDLGTVTFTDAEGNNIDFGTSAYTVDIKRADGKTNDGSAGTYTVTFKTANDKKLLNSVSTTIEVADDNFAGFEFYKYNTETQKWEEASQDGKLKDEFYYTGEAIDQAQLKDYVSRLQTTDGKFIDVDANYTVTYGTNKDAGEDAGRIIVTGTSAGYKGSKKVFTFDIVAINPQKTLSTVPNTVPYVKDAKAEDYKEAVAAVLKVVAAKDTAAGTKQVPMVAGTDYELVLTDNNDSETGSIGVDDTIKIKLKLLNNNFGTKDSTVDFATTKAAMKAISDSDIKIKGSYTYTGGAIDLDYDVVVDGVTLEKGKHYQVVSQTGINAGKGTITIKGINAGGYSELTTAKAEFTIEQADASDLIVEMASNYAPAYNGKEVKPTIDNIASIKLGKIDVMSQFEIDTTKYANNINAGDATLVLKPTEAGAKNFKNTKEVTFIIKKAALKADDLALKLLDKYGIALKETDYQGAATKFTADGTAQTFDKIDATVKVDAKEAVKELKEVTDYVIGYYNNTDATTTDAKAYAYIQIINPNYELAFETGVTALPTSADKAEDADVTNIINMVEFDIKGTVFAEKDIDIKNPAYAGGLVVKPEVTVYGDKGAKLTEGTDFEVVLKEKNQVETTVGKTLELTVNGLGKYKGTVVEDLAWGVDKKDLKDLDIKASTDKDGKVSLTVKNGVLPVDTEKEAFEVSEVKDGKVTVSVKDTNKNYTGSVDVAVNVVSVPEITASADRNMVNVNVTKDVDGATAYDYVLCNSEEDLAALNFFKSNKNVEDAASQFQFVRSGSYKVYVRAITRDADGKKSYSDWSEAADVAISTDTPNATTINKVAVSGNKVTVTFTPGARTQGVDVMLGQTLRSSNGEPQRPVTSNFTKYLQKNLNAAAGKRQTVTFTGVAKGTHYIGVHPYITSNDGLKYFGRWSKQAAATKVVIK